MGLSKEMVRWAGSGDGVECSVRRWGGGLGPSRDYAARQISEGNPDYATHPL